MLPNVALAGIGAKWGLTLLIRTQAISSPTCNTHNYKNKVHVFKRNQEIFLLKN